MLSGGSFGKEHGLDLGARIYTPLRRWVSRNFEIIAMKKTKAITGSIQSLAFSRRATLPLPNIKMGGKTGTVQVRRITMAQRAGGVPSNANLPWRFRDHGLFIAFAPVDIPRYAISVVVEHGGGSGSAYPIARDVMTFLYDPDIAIDALLKLEANWGGSIEVRMARKLAEFKSAQVSKARD